MTMHIHVGVKYAHTTLTAFTLARLLLPSTAVCLLCSLAHFDFVLRKKGSKTKKRTKEEDI